MTHVDDMIREALSAEDTGWFDELDEQSMPEMVLESFRGRHRWFVVAVYAGMLAFAAGMLIAAVQLIRAEDITSQIRWGTGFLFCLIAGGLLKVWYWMELNRIAMTRSIKRMELQLARLAHRLDDEA